jgi:AcrR family transcriptional regulator
MSPDLIATRADTATATAPLDPRTERTRQVVIAATAELLAEAGFGRITIEAIAERAGVARSTVYRNWPDRVDLLVEAWDGLCPEPAAADTGSVAGDLRRIATELARGLTSTAWGQAVPSLVGAVAGDDDLAQAMRRVSSQRRAIVAAALRRGIERGELHPDADVDEAAEVFGSRFFYRHLMSGAPLDDAFVDGHVALVIALCGHRS